MKRVGFILSRLLCLKSTHGTTKIINRVMVTSASQFLIGNRSIDLMVVPEHDLAKAYEEAKIKRQKTKQEIDVIIANFDNIELLSRLSALWYFVSGNSQEYDIIRERGHLHFLTGLCLKNNIQGNVLPTGLEVNKIRDLVLQYFDQYSFEIMFDRATKDSPNNMEAAMFYARNFALLDQVNYGAYQFQFDDFVTKVFGKMDAHFVKKVGFTVSDAMNFGQKIANRYERLLNERGEKTRKRVEEARTQLDESEAGKELRELFSNNNIDQEERLGLYAQYLMYHNIKEVFLFRADDFCREENIGDSNKFEQYLQAFSCKFGEENRDFDTPLDRNIIFTRPIIDIGNGYYFSPIPSLLYDSHAIFPTFLEDEITNNTSLGTRYKELKTRYVEDTIEEYLLRLFPKESIFKNLIYTYEGKQYEVDVLVCYDNKILVVEAKSGSLTEPARRGAPERLKSDLKDLMGKAYQQGIRTAEYIERTPNAKFKDKSGRIKLEIKLPPDQIDFFVINVTLTTLRWATHIQDLDVFKLFSQNTYPWSVSIFDLDIITRHISSPTIFIHYLEKRLAAQKEDFFYARSELEFLGWYLRHGNFYPIQFNGKTPDKVTLLNATIDQFEDHYLYGKEPPRLEIERDFLQIIETLEILQQTGQTKIASTLLDLYPEHRKQVLQSICEKTGESRNDGQMHSFLDYFGEPINCGIGFIAQCGSERLKEKLQEFCIISKYKFQAEKWIGIAKDVNDDEWFVNLILYIEEAWKQDAEMDKVVDHYFKKGA